MVPGSLRRRLRQAEDEMGMSDFVTPLSFVYITLPEHDGPVLNIRPEGTQELHRYALTFRQLIALNAQIATALEASKHAK
jgi:hypothetical protein